MMHLDLFSGIGGFAIAAQSVGFQTIGFSEIEPYACKLLKQHWPDVPNFGDIRNVRNVRADLVTGGFPCQPYSLAGERRGASDDRALWPEMRRVISESKPAWVLGENVPGIISMELDRVLSDLESLGYATWPIVIPACAVDAKHRRDRVWIVGNAARNSTGNQYRQVSMERKGLFHLAGRSQENDDHSRPSKNVANDDRTRQTDFKGRTRSAKQDRRNFPGASAVERGPYKWLPEPAVGRVVNGIPNRSHRLKGLGNAIVPQVAAQILRWMMELS